MNVNEVIKYPILTEKSEVARSAQNIYTFAVDKRCNKIEIRKAVEFIFDVKVLKVNIVNYDKKPTKLGRFQGFKNAVKKALVYLTKESKIILFADEAKEAEKEAKALAKEAKAKEVKEPTEAELKAAAKIQKAAQEKEQKTEKATPKNDEMKSDSLTKVATKKQSTKKVTSTKKEETK
ncbi:50S ribosomal protein L23 [Metamycoplasma buccale]|uniref:50S ribosomal protein L23 n=1 Tax=Metamycoplasma buccale TaxID=55602 RepID=UPI00398F578E